MRQSIRGYADGVMALAGSSGGPDLSAVASELAAVTHVIAGSDDLRRALTDPGVTVDNRRAILDQLFAERVGGTTMALIRFVLTVDRAAGIVDDIQWLAERMDASVHSMEPVGDVVLGTKSAEERADGFATAILATVEGERDLGEVEDELFRFSRIVAGSTELTAVLTSRDYPSQSRQDIIAQLLAGKASEATQHLAGYAARIGRPRDYQALLEHLVERVAEESHRRLAEVRSAVPMDDAQQARLAEALGRTIGHGVDVRVTVDPSVVAGFVAVIGDTVVDGSARHQLEVLKERLVLPESNVGQRTMSTDNITTGERP